MKARSLASLPIIYIKKKVINEREADIMNARWKIYTDGSFEPKNLLKRCHLTAEVLNRCFMFLWLQGRILDNLRD